MVRADGPLLWGCTPAAREYLCRLCHWVPARSSLWNRFSQNHIPYPGYRRGLFRAYPPTGPGFAQWKPLTTACSSAWSGALRVSSWCWELPGPWLSSAWAAGVGRPLCPGRSDVLGQLSVVKASGRCTRSASSGAPPGGKNGASVLSDRRGRLCYSEIYSCELACRPGRVAALDGRCNRGNPHRTNLCKRLSCG